MEDLSESRIVRPLLLAIANSIPVLAGVATGVDEAIQAQMQRLERERFQYLTSCFASGEDDFGGTIPGYLSHPVLHAAYVTIQTTLRTSRREKIRAFAKLFHAGVVDPPLIDLESEFEDYLKILDDLSIRELQLLYILNCFEEANPKTPEDSDYQWAEGYWSDFQDAAVARLSIPREELSGLIARLVRTGMFEPVYESAYGGPIFSAGVLTGAYKRLASLLGSDFAYFDSGEIPR